MIKPVDLYKLGTAQQLIYLQWLAIWRAEAGRLDAYRRAAIRREHPKITIKLVGVDEMLAGFNRIAEALQSLRERLPAVVRGMPPGARFTATVEPR